MRKFSALTVGIVIMMTLCASAAFPRKPEVSKGGTLELYQIDVSGAVASSGAKGEMAYNLSGDRFQFVFTGTKLEPNTEYTLIRSLEPEVTLPSRFEILASGTANAGGSLYIADSYRFNLNLLSARILLIPSQYENSDRPIEHLEKFLVGQTPISFEDNEALLKSGANLRPEDPNFDALGPQAGEQAPDFTLYGIENANLVGNAAQALTPFTLSELLKTKHVLLVNGAFT